MGKHRTPYPAEFRAQMAELVKAGRTPEEQEKEFEPTAHIIGQAVTPILVIQKEAQCRRRSIIRIAAAILLDREIGQPSVFRPEPVSIKETVQGVRGLRHRHTLDVVQTTPERAQSVPGETSQDRPDQQVFPAGG